MSTWRGNFDVVWDGKMPSADVVARVRQEIHDDLVDLTSPQDLVFHVVLLTDNLEGPSVFVCGGNEPNQFLALYSPRTEWITCT